jgi:hypothetical protein
LVAEIIEVVDSCPAAVIVALVVRSFSRAALEAEALVVVEVTSVAEAEDSVDLAGEVAVAVAPVVVGSFIMT